jgi:biopolymer transport protein ExbB
MDHMSVWELWESMGLLARMVFFLLVGLSVLSLSISVERYVVFRQARKQSLKFVELATKHLESDEPEAAIEAARALRHSHLGKVVSAGLMELDRASRSDLSRQEILDAARRAVERAMFTTTADLRRGISVLATTATVAPFIGLFGTIIGIINAFTAMAKHGSGGIGAVSAGIAEALVVTAIGLAVAIPAVALFNYFNGKVERFQMEMTNASSELLDFFILRHRKARAESEVPVLSGARP